MRVRTTIEKECQSGLGAFAYAPIVEKPSLYRGRLSVCCTSWAGKRSASRRSTVAMCAQHTELALEICTSSNLQSNVSYDKARAESRVVDERLKSDSVADSDPLPDRFCPAAPTSESRA